MANLFDDVVREISKRLNKIFRGKFNLEGIERYIKNIPKFMLKDNSERNPIEAVYKENDFKNEKTELQKKSDFLDEESLSFSLENLLDGLDIMFDTGMDGNFGINEYLSLQGVKKISLQVLNEIENPRVESEIPSFEKKISLALLTSNVFIKIKDNYENGGQEVLEGIIEELVDKDFKYGMRNMNIISNIYNSKDAKCQEIVQNPEDYILSKQLRFERFAKKIVIKPHDQDIQIWLDKSRTKNYQQSRSEEGFGGGEILPFIRTKEEIQEVVEDTLEE